MTTVQFNQLGSVPNTPFELTVKNSSGTDIAAGIVVSLDTTNVQGPSGTPPSVVLPSGNTDHVFGVTTGTIVNGKLGKVRCAGFVVATAGAALATVGVPVMPTSAGKVIAWTSTNTPCGHSVSVASADTEAVLIHFIAGLPATSSS